jgi:beta-glucanase (GH16 family)
MKLMNTLFLIPILYACGKNAMTNTSESGKPSISIADLQQQRDNNATSNFQFKISLDKISSTPVTFQYATYDGSAKATVNYTATSGSLTIPANENSITLSVAVKGDSLREISKTFYVQISNVVNAHVASPKATGTILCDGTYLPVIDSGYTTPSTYAGYTLAWNDEFDKDALDNSSWNYETGGNGWGNNELEYYSNSTKNCYITQHKYLVIEARNETTGNNNYTSARIQTLGKREFKYGRIDIRAKLPIGQGMWPALWMLGSNINSVSWPACGELDMMEVLGNDPGKTYGTLHWGDASTGHLQSGGNYALTTDDFSKKFHVFTTKWSADSISWYVDDVEYFTANRASIIGPNPFNNSFFFIFNVAVGGDWPKSPDGTTVFPQRMIVDYIRVFQ